MSRVRIATPAGPGATNGAATSRSPPTVPTPDPVLCDRTHKPCRAGDFESLHGLRHLLDDAARATEAVRPELEAVVGRLDRYLATELPPVPATAQAGVTEHTAQLEAR
ncbi:hypothetical protein [Streptomyces sp. NPDC058457]|uniref:hypothetical protein n=1 Tax=Streptomyces sp. NPDC058457 TaxID=3346507 RepID=UPI003650B7EB